jgi:dephospho-CoA kinase
MKFWIVTGGAATGKSAFCDALVRAVGDDLICHFSCDDAAHELWADSEIVENIIAAFGSRIEGEAGSRTIDRKQVRDVVFAEPTMRERLEKILHPPIMRKLEEARTAAQKAGRAKVFLAEVPLYYEIEASLPADTVIVVAATRTVQRTRLMEHRHLGVATGEGLLNAQLPLEIKTNKADVVVWNDGSPAILEAQAFALLRDRWEL